MSDQWNPPDCTCEFMHRSSPTCPSKAPSRGAIPDKYVVTERTFTHSEMQRECAAMLERASQHRFIQDINGVRCACGVIFHSFNGDGDKQWAEHIRALLPNIDTLLAERDAVLVAAAEEAFYLHATAYRRYTLFQCEVGIDGPQIAGGEILPDDNTFGALDAHVQRAVEQERERCAKIATGFKVKEVNAPESITKGMTAEEIETLHEIAVRCYECAAKDIAAAIRGAK